MAGYKLKIKIDTAKLRKILEERQKLLQHNIEYVLKHEALPHLIDRIMIGYDRLIDLAGTKPEDPTNPVHWRTVFLLKLNEDLERTFIVSGNRMSVKLGSKDFLGYNDLGVIDPDDTEPLHWLVFYIEGLLGDWAFITPGDYTKLTGMPYKVGWGRFSEGFMVSREEYEGNGWSRRIPFERVRHPFSGFSPVDIFAEALREFRLRPFIRKAITATANGRKL